MANDYYKRYYSQLDGALIVKFDGMNEDDMGGDGFPSFTVRLKNGEIVTLEVSQDPEGNGGGFVFGLPLPEQVSA